MNKASRVMLCLALLALVWAQTWVMKVEAQVKGSKSFINSGSKDRLPFINLPVPGSQDLASLVIPTLASPDFAMPPLAFSSNTSSMLYNAIANRLGIRYRFYGVDDKGYDCSGFVWRVFQDAGANFDRVAARTLWAELPEASGNETKEFGTLVFFNGLKHVGIVRDAYSFYHASRSQGVTLSFFAGYWDKKITGYRRAPKPAFPEPVVITD